MKTHSFRVIVAGLFAGLLVSAAIQKPVQASAVAVIASASAASVEQDQGSMASSGVMPPDGYVVCDHPFALGCDLITLFNSTKMTWVKFIQHETGISGATVTGLSYDDHGGRMIIYFHLPN